MIKKNPEQIRRDINCQPGAKGLITESKSKIDINAGIGAAVREYQTSVSPADYVLFVEKTAVAIIEEKKYQMTKSNHPPYENPSHRRLAYWATVF